MQAKWGSYAEFVMREPLLFADYMNVMKEEEVRLYEDVGDYTGIKKLFEEVSGGWRMEGGGWRGLPRHQKALEEVSLV